MQTRPAIQTHGSIVAGILTALILLAPNGLAQYGGGGSSDGDATETPGCVFAPAPEAAPGAPGLFIPADAPSLPVAAPTQPGSASSPAEFAPASGDVAASSGTRWTSRRDVGARRCAPAVTVFVDADNWETWWESNKFDFVELVREPVAPYSPQGYAPDRSGGLRATEHAAIRDSVVPALAGLVASKDAGVRGAAAVALGKLRDPEAVEPLQKLLSDGNIEVRRAAMLGLGVMDDGRSAWTLMNIARETRQGQTLLDERRIATDDRGSAYMLASLRGSGAPCGLVMPLLEEPDAVNDELLAAACSAAGLMGEADLIQSLGRLAKDTDLSPTVRSAAVTALGRIGDPATTGLLVDGLDEDLEPRRAAAAALGYVAHDGQRAVLERLAEAMTDDTDAPTRHFAAISLGRIGGETARAHLHRAFEDPRADMRPWLALALALCERSAGEPQARDEVVDLILARMPDEGNAHTTGAYMVALGLTGSPRALPTLTLALERSSVRVAGHAALGLGISGQPEAAAPLRTALAHRAAPFVVRQAALALGLLGDTASLPQMVDLMRTTNHAFVASYAALSLGFMGDAEAAGPLLDVIEKEGGKGLRARYAAAAVGQLFDPDPRPALSRLAAGDNYLARPSAVESLLSLGF